MNSDNPPPPFFRNGGGLGFEHHGGPGSLAWVIFALELLMLAALVVLVARAFAWRPRPAGPRFGRRPAAADPLDVVRYRYARGELTRDEYLQATHDLGGEPDARAEELPPS
jgi:uncharacterized membrane protein